MEAPPEKTEVTVKKTEKVDLRVTDFILRRLTADDFPEGRKPSPDELMFLKTAVKKWKNANGQVIYKLGKHVDVGRLCAVKGLGLQCFKREIRALLAAQYYWDVDMKNAQPVFLEQLCKKKGWACLKLSEYVAKREDTLALAAETMNCDRDVAKEVVTSFVFGCSRESVVERNLPPFFLGLWDELNWIREQIYDDKAYAELRKSVDRYAKRDKKNPKTSLAANVLQTIERHCLIAMDKALAEKGRNLATYIHDGGLVEKLQEELEFPEDLLRYCEAEVESETTYKITLAIKPLVSPIVVRDFKHEELENGYEMVKQRFEDKEGISKIIEKALFSQRTGVGIQLVSQDSIKVSYCDWKYKEKKEFTNDKNEKTWEIIEHKFLPRWLHDEKKKTWRNVSFWPSHNERAGILNTFDGFNYEDLLADDSIEESDENSMQLLNELCENVTDGNCEKLWDLMAYILQNPEKRTGVCVVLKGESGVGKDSILEFIGKLFGKKMYANIKDAARDVFGQFNGLMKEAVFVHLEEANSAVFMDPKLAEMFKALITSGNLPINQKHREQVDGHTYANFFLSTNRDIAVKIEADDRRFWLLQARAEHKGDSEYWERVHKALAQPSLLKSFASMLLKRDIKGFNPSTSRPETTLLDVTRRKNIELPIRFMNEVAFEQMWTQCETYNFDQGTLTIPAKDLHTKYCEWARAQELQHMMTLATFTDKLKLSCVVGTDAPISHSRLRFKHCGPNAVSAYAININKLKAWLREKKFVAHPENDVEPLHEIVTCTAIEDF